MQQNNTYKYLTFIFAIVALVFAVLYFTKPEPTAQEIYGDATANLETCNKDLADWQTKYGATASSTEKQEALDDILEDCQDILEDTSDTLTD